MDRVIENLGELVTSYELNECVACDQINGHHYYYAPVRGKRFYAYDLNTGEKLAEAYTGINSPRGCVVASDHRVYVCGDSCLFCFDPLSLKGEILPGFVPERETWTQGTVWCMTIDDQDNLYMGAHPDGSVYKYNTKTRVLSHSKRLIEGTAIIRSLGYYKGHIYASGYSGTVGGLLYKLDVETLELVDALDIQASLGKAKNMGIMTIVENVLIGGFSGLSQRLAVDLDAFQIIEVQDAVPCKRFMTRGRDRKYYCVCIDGGLYEYDPVMRKMTPVAGFEHVDIGFCCTKNALVTLNRPDLPGDSLLTCDEHDGTPVFYNLQTKKTVRWPDFVAEGDGGGSYVRAFASGPKGSGDIYLGAYQTGHCSVFNTGLQKVVKRYDNTDHQTDSQVWYRGKIYSGAYASGSLVEIDMETGRSRRLISMKKDYHQTRIHTVAAGGGKVFAGTTPDTGLYGGALVCYDVETGECYVEENLVKDQSIQCLVYRDGYLYGTGSTCGGTKTGFNGDAAKLFIYDVQNRKMVKEFTVELPGIDTPPFIAGIAADPKEAGKFWGIVSETLFSFTVDEYWNAAFREELSFAKDTYYYEGSKQWFPRPILFGEDGYLYAAFDEKGCTQRVNPLDPKGDHTRILDHAPMHYILGEDGNFYYAENMTGNMATLFKLILN